MLVKFLSFAASLIGTGRYKPILLTGLFVLLSLSSIVALGSWKDDQGRLVASRLLLKEDKNTRSPQEFQGKQEATITQTTASSSETATKPTEATSTPSATAPTLDLSTQAVTLVAGRTSDALSASVKSGTWDFSISSEDSDITVRSIDTTNTSVKFNLTALDTTQPGTYRVAVQAKDKDTGKIVLTKTIVVTVVAQ